MAGRPQIGHECTKGLVRHSCIRENHSWMALVDNQTGLLARDAQGELVYARTCAGRYR